MSQFIEAFVEIPEPYDFRKTLGPYRLGRHDPTCRLEEGVYRRALWTEDGPATLQFTLLGGAVQARAWGEGGRAALAGTKALLGLRDDPSRFAPTDRRMLKLLRKVRGLRLARVPWVSDTLFRVILQQRVSGAESKRSFHTLVRRQRLPFPGPAG